ncbi:MAG: aminopeptidase P family protein [Alphaproteobacteria bacterium]|nr:aminopeptidase P family protein [Alphaproteobacteria bacterium]
MQTRSIKSLAKEAALVGALDKAGILLGGAAALALIKGVAASADEKHDAAWLAQIAPTRSAALDRQLIALKNTLRIAMDRGDEKNVAPARLAALRSELRRQSLDGFLVPLADEHQGEYVARRARRLAWLTGFTGSAGIAIVLAERAAIFVDGRYTLQAAAQVDGTLYERHHLTEVPPDRWLAEHLRSGLRLGYDPWLHTEDGRARYLKACKAAGADLIARAANPLDAVWHDQPPPPLAPIVPHALEFAGRAADEKQAEIAALIKTAKADAAILSAPDSIAWLLNVRGGDVACTPLPHGFAIVGADSSVALFVDPRKISPDLRGHLGHQVSLAAPDGFGPALDALGALRRAVLIDPQGAPCWAVDRLTMAGATIMRGADPCARPKACKNAIELDGTRAAHRRDGAALVRFLAWLERAAAKGRLKESAAADRLLTERQKNDRFMGPSFETISGAGPNGAIVHYRVTPATDRRLEPGMLYLLDSGGQYLDGTTDVTRTIAVGKPSPEQRDRFTRVLKGHIALALARFPSGTSGSQLDALARQHLWQAGLDFDHGTGHGVGSYLGVHEGPQRISKLPNTVALEPGMIVSNEPGYYKTGAFGIRIENLVVVQALEGLKGTERPMRGFETLTLVPIDRRLVDTALMSADELAWLNTYHAMVRERLSPLLKGTPEAMRYLRRATLALKPPKKSTRAPKRRRDKR